jgi:regulator of cell morphogenesis and NO signaling
MTLTANTQVGELAAAHPATIKVFQRYGIDYCCGGRQPIRRACFEHGAPLDVVLLDLSTAMEGRSDAATNWRTTPIAVLIRHIVDNYHRPQGAAFARLGAMMAKVMDVHGNRWPALLTGLAETLDELRMEASTHTRHEEQKVFPAILAMERTGHVPAAFDVELDNLERDHAGMGALLARLQAITGDYRAPEGACNTVIGLYHGLKELADGLREHVTLENHVLFPRTAALARRAR